MSKWWKQTSCLIQHQSILSLSHSSLKIHSQCHIIARKSYCNKQLGCGASLASLKPAFYKTGKQTDSAIQTEPYVPLHTWLHCLPGPGDRAESCTRWQDQTSAVLCISIHQWVSQSPRKDNRTWSDKELQDEWRLQLPKWDHFALHHALPGHMLLFVQLCYPQKLIRLHFFSLKLLLVISVSVSGISNVCANTKWEQLAQDGA